jgi:hypothetical protein
MIIQHWLTKMTNQPFSNKHVRRILDKYIRHHNEANFPSSALFIDPFARDSFTTVLPGCLTNDLNSEMPTTYHAEANEWCEWLLHNRLGANSVDLIFFDPPYSLRLLKDHYDHEDIPLERWQTWNMFGRAKNACAKLLKVNGHFISFGYTTRGLGRRRGFDKEQIHILQSNKTPDSYDVLMTIERKVQHNLESWFEEE